MTLLALCMTDDLTPYPGVSGFNDRHGKRRYKYRRRGVSRTIPGAPHTPEFDKAYAAAIEGREPKAQVIKHPNARIPKSIGAAWEGVATSIEWRSLDPKTQAKDAKRAEDFLLSPVAKGGKAVWKDQSFADLKRKHVKMIIERFAHTPHKARQILVVIRKMATYALDEEWVAIDPTHGVSWNPKTQGTKAWPEEERTRFEAHHALGTMARTAYGIALWTGLRVSDVVLFKWSFVDFEKRVVSVPYTKGRGGWLKLPLAPDLEVALLAVDRVSDFVLVTPSGKPYSHKSMTGNMQRWTRYAELPEGHTFHGLRKTLGKMIAESEGTTRELMEVLGHKSIQYAELYSREAEQERLAQSAMGKVVRFQRRV